MRQVRHNKICHNNICHKNNSLPLFFVVSLSMVLLIAGCNSTPVIPTVKDSGPSKPVYVTHVPDAVPKVEPRTIAGNKSPYTVFGKTYRVLPGSDNYKARGVASWYGRKFHGQHTSNGDIYDMYAMTAAHKTLPIPTYVRVTNLNNGRSVIVRVNDRGPFHGDRIIDLSYAAAQKLGFQDIGTAAVEVEAIDPVAYQRQGNQRQGSTIAGTVAKADTKSTVSAQLPTSNTGSATGDSNLSMKKVEKAVQAKPPGLARGLTYLQAGAFSTQALARQLQDKIAVLISYPVFVSKENVNKESVSRGNVGAGGVAGDGKFEVAQQLFKVRIGPLNDELELLSIKELLQLNQLPTPLVVYD